MDDNGMDASLRPSRGRRVGAVVLAVLASGWLAGCGAEVSAVRDAAISAEGIASVRIVADAGRIELVGEAGQDQITASGTAFATNNERLNDLGFELTTNGDELVIEARAPGLGSHFDVTIAVPNNIAAVIGTGAGNITVRGVESVEVSVGAGEINIRNVHSDVLIDSVGVGNLDISEVSGDVEVRELGAGNVDVTGVEGNVGIRQVGTGNVTVSDVDGDLTVGNVGIGQVSHRQIRGAVTVP